MDEKNTASDRMYHLPCFLLDKLEWINDTIISAGVILIILHPGQ